MPCCYFIKLHFYQLEAVHNQRLGMDKLCYKSQTHGELTLKKRSKIFWPTEKKYMSHINDLVHGINYFSFEIMVTNYAYISPLFICITLCCT